MIIRKKTEPKIFQKVLNGNKKFDIRINDFNCNIGDILILEEFDPILKKYTGRKIKKKIEFLIKTNDFNNKYWKEEDIKKYGFVVMQFS